MLSFLGKKVFNTNSGEPYQELIKIPNELNTKVFRPFQKQPYLRKHV